MPRLPACQPRGTASGSARARPSTRPSTQALAFWPGKVSTWRHFRIAEVAGVGIAYRNASVSTRSASRERRSLSAV
jgi:hypothetical protein